MRKESSLCVCGKRSLFLRVWKESFSLRVSKESSLTIIMTGACAGRELSLRVWKESSLFACVEKEFSHDHHERAPSQCSGDHQLCISAIHVYRSEYSYHARAINARLHSKQNPFRSCTCRAPACV